MHKSRIIEPLWLFLKAAFFVVFSQQTALAAEFDAAFRAYNRSQFETARNAFTRLAERGHAGAQFYLGEIFEGGVGIAMEQKTAFNWYRKAAQQNHPGAQARLAAMYFDGRGLAVDKQLAFHWYQRAAQQGHVLSQYHLARLYASGIGVKADPVRAYMWWTIAASYGDPDAIHERATIVDSLSDNEIIQAQTLALEWEFAWESRPRGTTSNP